MRYPVICFGLGSVLVCSFNKPFSQGVESPCGAVSPSTVDLSITTGTMQIIPATLDDISELEQLVHSCYRTDVSRKGWTTDADLIEGLRLTPDMLKNDMTQPGAQMLKALDTDNGGKIVGCVLTIRQENKMYLGIMCVHPDIQAQGLGRKLVNTVNEMAEEMKCKFLRLDVVSARSELIAWYERLGFQRTGETIPLAACFGKAKVPLNLIYMEREV